MQVCRVSGEKFTKNDGGGKSNYTQGGDNTPKTDLYGGAYHISLKEGNAQLASSKAGETKGVMKNLKPVIAIKIAQNMGTKVSDDIKDAIDNIVGKGYEQSTRQ